MAKLALITVTHDPIGKNMKLFQALQKEIEDIYSEIFITVSDETSMELIKEIEKSKFHMKVIPKKAQLMHVENL
ncbi:hypothetical protein KDN24_19510 [Bacillus sp. Bva_UNVM-123]|uniref:hypothetical protein n=1 Tax=Bacillus sp. Bva_UNVM-123 TaxID=2829798 RepID=UPI00391F2B62